jgi:hypothetical protein
MDVSFSDAFGDTMFVDAETVLNPQEVKNIDEDVYSVIYSKAVAQKIFPTKQIPRGMREFLFSIARESSAPIFSKDFLPESVDKVTKAETTVKLVGISKDYFLSMVDIDASRNSNYHSTKIDTLHLREITALVADYKERVLWRGYDIRGPDPGAIETGVIGIITQSGIQTFEAGIGGNDETGSPGDGPFTCMKGAQALLNYHYEPPFVVVMTPQLYGQFCLNMNTTTHITDIERIQSMVDANGNKMFSGIYITPHLVNVAEDGTNAAIVVLATKTNAGEPTGFVIESYPLWHYPITISRLGIQGKILWMGSFAGLRPKAIALAAAINIDGIA